MPWAAGDFFGEAAPFDWWKDVTGTVIASSPDDGYEMTYRYPPVNATLFTQPQYLFEEGYSGPLTTMPDSLTFIGGDSFMGECYPDMYYLTPTTPAEFTLAIDFGEATSGTVRLSAGGDPDWNLTSPALATTDLGTWEVAGAQRVLVKIEGDPAFTVENFLDYDLEPLIYVEILAGTIEISYVRVRVWPPDGPSGAWRSIGTWTVTGKQPAWARSSVGVTATGPDYGGGWASAGPDHSGPFGAMQEAFSAAKSTFTYVDFTGLQPEVNDGNGQMVRGDWSYYWSIQPLGHPHEFTGTNNCGMVLIWGYNVPVSNNPDSSVNGGFTYSDPDITPYDDYGGVRGGVGAPVLGTVSGWSGSLTYQSADPTGHIVYRTFPATLSWVDETHTVGFPITWHEFDAPPSAYSVASAAWDGLVPTTPTSGTILTGHPDTVCWGIEVFPYQLITPEDDITLYDPWNSSAGIGSYTAANASIGYGNLRFNITYSGAEVFDPSLPYVDDTPPELHGDAGYFRIPNPNLGGGPVDIRVNFAST